MTGRSIAEWIAASPDAKVPPRVRLRIFNAHGGVCHISGRKIEAGELWDLEHIVPLSMGGEHRESNLRPALRDKHKEKSAREAEERAKADAAAKRHLGVRTRPVAPLKSAPFPRSIRTAGREPKPSLPPRGLFR